MQEHVILCVPKAFNKLLRSIKEEPLSVIEFVGARLCSVHREIGIVFGVGG